MRISRVEGVKEKEGEGGAKEMLVEKLLGIRKRNEHWCFPHMTSDLLCVRLRVRCVSVNGWLYSPKVWTSLLTPIYFWGRKCCWILISSLPALSSPFLSSRFLLLIRQKDRLMPFLSKLFIVVSLLWSHCLHADPYVLQCPTPSSLLYPLLLSPLHSHASSLFPLSHVSHRTLILSTN